MSKKILISLGIIAVVSALAIGGTVAYFSDTETSTGNTFAAGSIDLKIDNHSWYNGKYQSQLSWEPKDLEDELFFNFSDLKPGDWGEDTISIKVENNDNRFLCKCEIGELLNIPIAHAEGNYFIEEDGLKSLYDNGQVLLTYCDKDGNSDNPNGSVDSIAGICNKKKNIFGLMPHPERAIETILGSDDGIKMLEGFLT